MTGIINIVDNNENGIIIEDSSSDSSDSGSSSTPSYGYGLDLEVDFGNNQDFIPIIGYDI
jgi:hypothetical protein